MRVLLVQPLSHGGIAQYGHQLGCALSDAGHQVIVLAAPDYELASRVSGAKSSPRFVPRLFPSTSMLQRFRARPLRGLLIGLASIIDCHRLLNIAFALRPTVIHVQGGHPMDLVYLLAARLAGRPLIYTAHNVVPHRPAPYHRLLHRLIYWLPHFTIVHTQHGRKQLLNMFRLEQRRVRVIPMPLFELYDARSSPPPAAARAALGLRADDEIVLFFGQIRPNKGLPTLLRAIAQLRPSRPRLRLLITGEPLDGIKEVLSLIRELGLGASVKLHTNYVPLEQVAAYFQAADVVALPYVRVTQSAVLSLALAFNKPVVASRVGGLPELAERSAIASLVPPEDHAALAQAISAQLDHPSTTINHWHGLRWPEAAGLTAALYAEAAGRDHQN